MTMKTSGSVSLAFVTIVVFTAGCTSSSSALSDPAVPPTQSTTKHDSAGAGTTEPVRPSLKSQLDGGGTLIVTIQDPTLANDVNDRMNKGLVLLQHGKETIRGDDMANFCQVGSENGYLHSGDRFELKSTDITDKVFLAATQVYLHASSHLGIQCRKGGMDQTEMTLSDLQEITGSLVTFEFESSTRK
jgi:hypothetical protein